MYVPYQVLKRCGIKGPTPVPFFGNYREEAKMVRSYIKLLASSLVSKPRPLPLQRLVPSFRINTWREGLGDCLYRYGSRLCNIYVTSHFEPAHTMPRASQLIFIWPLLRAVSLTLPPCVYTKCCGGSGLVQDYLHARPQATLCTI